jgi:hypothetical protein
MVGSKYYILMHSNSSSLHNSIRERRVISARDTEIKYPGFHMLWGWKRIEPNWEEKRGGRGVFRLVGRY